jgi:hypothetical protein
MWEEAKKRNGRGCCSAEKPQGGGCCSHCIRTAHERSGCRWEWCPAQPNLTPWTAAVNWMPSSYRPSHSVPLALLLLSFSVSFLSCSVSPQMVSLLPLCSVGNATGLGLHLPAGLRSLKVRSTPSWSVHSSRQCGTVGRVSICQNEFPISSEFTPTVMCATHSVSSRLLHCCATAFL